ncbi:Serine acetyltransferase [Anaerohalosphaera lusitana]|uniref:serine O-acetyltransferase n=1 Tax=Anaerohalosphaera lusitana TaxID=1936003 RepID=A0A1U9NP71_9BACT|nr:serine O-acetyltransferase EpsC [Anaerohalosphaera lusitana]AQT69597.1 Serine acetyltransferase [Anaerohalosphaera lusitana]
MDKATNKLVDSILETYEGDSGINFIDVTNLPVKSKIVEIFDMLMEIAFPGYTGKRRIARDSIRYTVGDIVCRVRHELAEQIERALKHKCRLKPCPGCDCHEMAVKITEELLNQLPNLREVLKGDVQAAYDGDPAAESFEEIVISYPFIHAITAHRIAHELYVRDVPLIPRMISENAHSKTGIDIHPGARIGRNFFIDHGTGVVIGETTEIGENVKIYQGVTLGAISFPKDERGEIIRGQKRHPTLEDDVTIYAEATILGAVTIGKGAVIGGNVWIKKSVEPGKTIAMKSTKVLERGPGGKSDKQ